MIKLNLDRNRASLGIRCRWGIRNALFYIAKDSEDINNQVLGIAMWMPPKPVEQRETWGEWSEGWKLWTQQVGMNMWYGRGGLNVKVCRRKLRVSLVLALFLLTVSP